MIPAVIILSSVPGSDLEPAARDARQLVPHVLLAENPRGYGAAFAIAFARAIELGCTHAIVLDVARGHQPRYLPTFLAAAAQSPDAIIVGVRHYDAEQPSSAQRFGRWNCDLWTWIETGRWIRDTTYGYKAYPLALAGNIAVRSEQTDCEVELFAKALWAGVGVVQIPLATDARTEALVPLRMREAIRFGATTTRLTVERFLLPAPLRETMHQRSFADLPVTERIGIISRQAIAHHCDAPARFATCIGIGVFFGILPIWGFQMIAAAATAHLLGLSKHLVLAASYVSSPLTLPIILYASLVLGQLMLHGQFTGLPRPDELQRSALLPYLGEYVAGSILLAIAAGLVSSLLAFVAASLLKSLRGAT